MSHALGPRIVVAGWRRNLVDVFNTYQFEVWVALLAAALGIPGLFNEDLAPAAMQDVYPTTLLHLWAGMLASGGLLKLWGLLRHNLRIRQAGLMLLGGCTAVVCVSFTALLVKGDLSRLANLIVYGLFAAACFSRFRVLGRLREAEQGAQRIINAGAVDPNHLTETGTVRLIRADGTPLLDDEPPPEPGQEPER